MPAPAGASSSQLQTLETFHTEQIHDLQLDYYGRRLATCSSDRTIKIFDVDSSSGTSSLVDTLTGHSGPVWSVAWLNPKFGNILASCGYDGQVLVWRESQGGHPQHGQGSQNGKYEIIKSYTHGASVNGISWAPHELGPSLATASSDGKVSVLTFNDDNSWDVALFAAHNIGVNAVSWAPAIVPSSLIAPSSGSNASPTFVKKFATGGCDSLIKIWAFNSQNGQWFVEETLEGHTDMVRDVVFAPSIGLSRTYLASCGQDRTVVIWTQDGTGKPWEKKLLNPLPYLTPASGQQLEENKFPDSVWKLSWSVTGNTLAVSAGDGKVSLWKENLKSEWECVSEVTA